MPVLVVSVLARVEVPAAISRKHRMGDLSADAAAVLIADFEADYYGTDTEAARFAVVGVDEEILSGAARLCSVHGLRAYDADPADGAASEHTEHGALLEVPGDPQNVQKAVTTRRTSRLRHQP